MLRRATLIVVIALGAVVSQPAYPQQSPEVQRIGFLGPTLSVAPSPSAPNLLDVLRGALADFGLVEGREIMIESRWPDGGRLDLLPETAAALVNLKPVVIVAIGATAARAAMA